MNSKKQNLHRLILVTNREPFHYIEREGKTCIERSTGGLVTALEPAMEHAKEAVWISASSETGINSELINQQISYQWIAVNYDKSLHEGYYSGFSNRVLWPLFHSMIGNQMKFQIQEWKHYQEVNHEFANAIMQISKPDDFIWIHDYQLTLVPDFLRKREIGQSTRIGFFLHIPFPSYDLFRTLPWGAEILKGMLGANLIGFHISDYCQHFFNCVEAILKIRCDRNRGLIYYENRVIRVKAIPIGIDVAKIHEFVREKALIASSQKLREEVGTKYLIMGVDRLDYTKGILKRLSALEKFFERYPKHRGQVSMIQLAVPTRTEIEQYRELREEIERLVGHINGLHAQPGWTPITYMCRSLPPHDLFALYHAADIGLVTPLRDGMNLVAKEYIAAHHNNAGVLILSELAGAAEELTDAIIVNPYDDNAIAEAINTAVRMPLAEQKKRIRKLNETIMHYDVYGWVNKFISEANSND
jgi:trehalose 6-phosphate synthase/phosphatase